MSYYIIEADNMGDLTYELLTCEHCRYFRKADEHEYRYKDSCAHSAGMVRPYPDGFCSYASLKPIYEREEQDNENGRTNN